MSFSTSLKSKQTEITIMLEPMSLNQLCSYLQTLFQLMAQNKGLELHLCQQNHDDILIADELRLRQLLSNLLSNAIKFTKQGQVSLQIQPKHQEGNHIWFEFMVQGTGHGISDEQQARLFQALNQADNSITREFGDTGLGLVISQRLVQAMGGDGIKLKSQVNQGSTFSFSLPLGIPTQEQLDAFHAKQKKHTDTSRYQPTEWTPALG